MYPVKLITHTVHVTSVKHENLYLGAKSSAVICSIFTRVCVCPGSVKTCPRSQVAAYKFFIPWNPGEISFVFLYPKQRTGWRAQELMNFLIKLD